MTISPSKSRHAYLDILRTLASFLVCYNHAFGYHLFLEQEADGSLMSWVNVILSSPVAVNIPLFFMISGALLLGKQESYRVLFRKRICRVLVLIAAASVVTYLLIPVPEPSVRHFLSQFFSGTVNGSHWYLFAYLSLLLLLPFLRPMVQAMTGWDLLFLTLLRTIFRPGLAILNFWLQYWGLDAISLSVHMQLPLSVIDYFFCPIAGYWLAHKLQIQNLTKKHLAAWIAVFFGGCLISSLMAYAEGMYSGFTQDHIREFSYSSAMALFVLVRYAAEKFPLPKRLEAFFAAVSSVAVGIFLLEPIVVHYLYDLFFARIPWQPVIITVFSALWSVVCMAVGGSITWALRKIPGVKKYL